MMHFEHFDDKRKEKRKYLRLKIITNRQFNFITAIRPDSTVTDLANRALNVYLQLTQQQKIKKQLTVSAVKQGRYFMPKSQIVSNLLSQDEEVEIMIVKAKPKFPEQTIPSQHDFEVLAKQIRHFDVSVSKRPSSSSSKMLFANEENEIKKNRMNNKKIDEKSSSSESRFEKDSKSLSMGSQIQYKKRANKKQRRLEKANIKLNRAHLNTVHKPQTEQKQAIDRQQNKPIEIVQQASKYEIHINESFNNPIKGFQNHAESEKKQSLEEESIQIDPMSLITFNDIKNFTPDKIKPVDYQKSAQKISQKSQQKINEKSTNKKDKQTPFHPKIPQPLINQQPKRDFIAPPKSQTSQQKIQEPKKKVKLDPSIKFTEEISISRKGSVDNRSQKTPKVNPIPSPKVVFHFQTKHESPKVIYIPQSKTISEMKENIEREKEKMRSISPLILPKSSPKITFLQDTLERIPEKGRPLTSSLSKKRDQMNQDRKQSMDEEKPEQVQKQKELPKTERQPSSPKLSSYGNSSIPNSSSIDQRRLSSSSVDERRYSEDSNISVDEKRNNPGQERKSNAMRPQIIVEQSSSEQENCITINPNNNKANIRTLSKESQLSALSNLSQSQSDESTIKKKSSTSSKFHQIQNMIRKFKLQESSDEEERVQMEAQ